MELFGFNDLIDTQLSLLIEILAMINGNYAKDIAIAQNCERCSCSECEMDQVITLVDVICAMLHID